MLKIILVKNKQKKFGDFQNVALGNYLSKILQSFTYFSKMTNFVVLGYQSQRKHGNQPILL